MTKPTDYLCITLLVTLAVRSTASANVPPELSRWLQPQVWEKDTAGPIISLGKPGDFDDMHIFAPAVAEEKGVYSLWYCGSRGTRGNRIFRLGLATGTDGKQFQKYEKNPVFEMGDSRSVVTPTLLRTPEGNGLREGGKLRMWFTAADLAKTGYHAIHETISADGIHWSAPSPPEIENAYAPTVIKSNHGYEMWYTDVIKRPWLIRHAVSDDGIKWTITEKPVLELSQAWEAEIVLYPTVIKIDGVYLMWYGSYHHAVRRQTTAIGFAASLDGKTWHKHPENPVLKPDVQRPWESNYVTSGCVMRLADGSYRYWYASRKAPPFENLYFAINTAKWAGPVATAAENTNRLPLPPKKGDVGIFLPATAEHAREGRSVDVLEIVDEDDVIVRAWYSTMNQGLAFVDLWLHGLKTTGLKAGSPAMLSQNFEVIGNKSFGTTCGQRSIPLLHVVESKPPLTPAEK